MSKYPELPRYMYNTSPTNKEVWDIKKPRNLYNQMKAKNESEGGVQTSEKLKTNPQGQKYEYEKNGTYYGGDFLQESPKEIYIENTEVKDDLIEEENRKEIKEKEEQLATMLEKSRNAIVERQFINEHIDRIIKEKGYDRDIHEIQTILNNIEDGFSEKILINSKEVAKDNINRIKSLVKGDKDSLSVYRLNSTLDRLVGGEISEKVLYDTVYNAVNKGLILESDFSKEFTNVNLDFYYVSKLLQQKGDILSLKENDLEIIDLKKKIIELTQIIEDNSSYKIRKLEREINELELKFV